MDSCSKNVRLGKMVDNNNKMVTNDHLVTIVMGDCDKHFFLLHLLFKCEFLFGSLFEIANAF